MWNARDCFWCWNRQHMTLTFQLQKSIYTHDNLQRIQEPLATTVMGIIMSSYASFPCNKLTAWWAILGGCHRLEMLGIKIFKIQRLHFIYFPLAILIVESTNKNLSRIHTLGVKPNGSTHSDWKRSFALHCQLGEECWGERRIGFTDAEKKWKNPWGHQDYQYVMTHMQLNGKMKSQLGD